MIGEKESLRVLKAQVKDFPDTVVILGSGWNRVLDGVKVEKRISYSELFGAKTSVAGHMGELVIGKTQIPNSKFQKKSRVAFMSGRFHMYEGYSAEEVTLPIRVLAKAGMKKLIVTAAAGGLNEKYKVGDFVVVSDLITLFLGPLNPLVGPKFIDVSEVFDVEMMDKAERILVEEGIDYREGVYVFVRGPHYETPADKMALRFLGADMVGMSTVPEALEARSLGVKILGLAFVTNLAFVKHNHKDVIAQANRAGEKMAKLLLGLI